MTHDKAVITKECFDGIDFRNGLRQTHDILCVRYPDGIYLKLYDTWGFRLTIERDGHIFKHQVFRKNDAQLLIFVERWVKDISDGKYTSKKTEREQIRDIVINRRLTSYMNNTKWNEFRTAMIDEMPFEPPYDYKTLFDDDEYIYREHIQHMIKNAGPTSFSNYDGESFNFLDYKGIEWVKIRPRFFILEGGQLVKKEVWYDCEKELVAILKKYTIAYEVENGIYTIYGYK